MNFNQCLLQGSLFFLACMLLNSFTPNLLRAETIDVAQVPNPIPTPPPPRDILPPATTPTEPQTPPLLPPPEDLLQTPSTITPTPPTPEVIPSQVPGNITVQRFEVVGSTVFSPEKLAEATAKFTNKPISFAELLQASAAITQLYTEKGYLTSGAFIPANQTFKTQGGVVQIQVVEGSLEDIKVSGTRRLEPNYVKNRLGVATSTPLNFNKLLEALQLLQLDPLIKNISAELTAGARPGTSLLLVEVAEAKTLSAQINLANNRPPTIGTFQRQIQLTQANLLGRGDAISAAYTNTDGSNGVDVTYTVPISSRNGTLQLSYSNISSNIIEPPFDTLDIEGNFKEYLLTIRQPIIQTPRQEFALGITAARRESDVGFLEALIGERIPFPTPGSDPNGFTRLSILRFFQDFTQRNRREVIAARSQLSIGASAFDSTINSSPPDSRFFAWRGQAQYVRQLAPETLFIVRADVQLADRALVPLEQIGIGGQDTVRGYRQDLLLTDNGALASAEFRYPIVRVPKIGGVLQIAPFIDFGTGWNNSGNPDPDPNTLAGIGLGLRWQQSNNLNARFDYGIPLISDRSRNRTLQEQGFYFSVTYNQPF